MHKLTLKQVAANSAGLGNIAISQDGKYLATTAWGSRFPSDPFVDTVVDDPCTIIIYDITSTFLTPKPLAVCTFDLYEPYGICFVADSNNILACSGEADKPLIIEFTVQGEHVRTILSHSLGCDIIHKKDEFLVSASNLESRFLVSATNLESRFFSGVVMHDYATGAVLRIIGSYGSGKGQLSNPSGLALTTDGYVLVCDSDNHRVSKFNTETGEFAGHVFSSPSGEEYPVAVMDREDGSCLVLCIPDIRRTDPVTLYTVQSLDRLILNRLVLFEFEEPAAMAYCFQTDTLFLKDVSFLTSNIWALDDGWHESARCALITALVMS